MRGRSFLYNLYSDMSISVIPKKRGRPATGKDPLVGVRMSRDITEAIEAYIADQDPPPPNRSEAIRAMLRDWLVTRGYLES